MTTWRARLSVVVSCALITACADDKPKASDSTAVVAPAPAPATVPAPTTGWEEAAAGPVMFLSFGDNLAATSVVFPLLTDSTIGRTPVKLDSLSNVSVELFSRRGLSGSTSLVVTPGTAQSEGCLSWPTARLAEAPSEPWRAGFIQGVVAPIPLDSLETMSGPDSAFVTRELARLSSALAEGDDPAFRGLPFSVRKAYRFSLRETSVLAGDVVRKINEEANPREEHLLVVGERPATATDGYSAVFHTRVAGAEDAVRTNEILSAVRFVKTQRPALVISFEYEDGGRVALLQRMSAREWKITWRSAYTGC